MSLGQVVILGRTYREADYWRHEYVSDRPDLENAVLLSTFGVRSIEGRRIRKAYVAPGVAPGARRGHGYGKVLAVTRRALLKTPGSVDDVICLSERSNEDYRHWQSRVAGQAPRDSC
jgi:uncharacterized SAM-binding protein YcdF (DUF218 family)